MAVTTLLGGMPVLGQASSTAPRGFPISATDVAFNRGPFQKRVTYKFDPMTNTGRYEEEEFLPGGDELKQPSGLRVSAGPQYQRSTPMSQQAASVSSAAPGVSGIEFEFAGGDSKTGVARPKGYQGTYDPLYDPKFAFWKKGIPSKYYDPVDPSKPISFPERSARERAARARWIGDMTDEEFSFYMRSLNQGPGSAGQEAGKMRELAKNPPPPKEEYGDPAKNLPPFPGPIGFRQGSPESTAQQTSVPERKTSRTGLGKSTTALPATTTVGAVPVTSTTRQQKMADRARKLARAGA